MYTDRLTTLMFCGGIMLLAYVLILVLIFCDLRAGVRKARQRHEKIYSDGYKRTIEKISKYFSMTFALSIIDLFQLAMLAFLYHFYGHDIIMLPWFTMIAFGYVAFVEIRSIWEPADIKEKKQQEDYRRAILALIKEYGGIDKVLGTVMSDQKKGTADAEQQYTAEVLDNDNF